MISPCWNQNTDYDCDLAVINLPQPLDLVSSNIQPVSLLFKESSENHQTSSTKASRVYGWGRNDNRINSPLELKKGNMIVENWNICMDKLKTGHPDYRRTINFLSSRVDYLCATGDSEYGKHAQICESDSGGPLMAEYHDQDVQIGITTIMVNQGDVCAAASKVNIFTNVAFHADFIKSAVKDQENLKFVE